MCRELLFKEGVADMHFDDFYASLCKAVVAGACPLPPTAKHKVDECTRLSGKVRNPEGKLMQRYPDVRGLLTEGESGSSARVKLWKAVHSMGSGYDPDREGKVITELKKLQDQVRGSSTLAADEAEGADMEPDEEEPFTSDSEEEQ